MNESKTHSLYRELFISYFCFVFIVIFIIILLFSYIANRLIINLNTHSYISTAEKQADNLSYAFQQNVALAYTLASSENVIFNIQNFNNASPIEQIDYDLALTNIFESYSGYNSGIRKIRIFFPESIKDSTSGFRSICYLSIYNSPDWLRFFQSNSGTISAEYSCDISSYTVFHPDRKYIAIIVPVIKNQKTIAFLVMDIDKNILFDGYFDSSSYTVFDNTGTVIYDTSNLELGSGFVSDVTKSPVSLYGHININKNKLLYFTTEYTMHGFKIVQFLPYSQITKHRPVIIVIFILTSLLLFVITAVFVKRKTLHFTNPLSELADAMRLSVAISENNTLPTEMKILYDTYNNLLSENTKMINDINESKERQHNSEIKVLLAQISPHFLYNTLNTVVWKATNAGQSEICSIISKLSKLCRLSYRSTDNFVPLKTELVHAELYLQIQQEAFEQPFDYNLSVPDDILELKVPRFILQPIVENSILHGFAQIVMNGLININAQKCDALIITITDNGIGISDDNLAKLNSNKYISEKYGIRNINQRIKLLCGENYGIIFESNGHSYTKAVITLPIIDNKPETGN